MAASIGPYTIHAELGRGSFGVVYLAQRAGLEARCAVKVLTDLDPEGRARFDLEARVASKLQHPGIVPVIDAGVDQGRAYYVMPYCPGESLESRLRQGPLSPNAAARLVGALASAVDYAHAQGVIHRDIKPGNVLLSEPDGRPRLTDFGLARDPSLRTSLTRTGTMLGSPVYMAPEQWTSDRDVDARADVYALGVVLYACLTGQRPFSATSMAALSDQVFGGQVTPLERLAPEVPPALAAVVRQAMAVERRDRFLTAGALASALARSVVTHSPAGPTREPSRAGPWVAAVVLVVAALCGGIAWRVTRAPVDAPAEVVRAPEPAGAQSPEAAPSPSPEATTPDAAAEETTARDSPEESWVPLADRDPPRLSQPVAVEGIASLAAARIDELDGWLVQPAHVDGQHRDRDGWTRLSAALESARAEQLDDPRLVGYEVVLGLADEADPLAVRRRLLTVAPTPQVRAIAARISSALGFDRAAIDQALAACLAFDWHAGPGLTAIHVLLYPVGSGHDPRAAAAVGERVVLRLQREGLLEAERPNPPGWDVLANLAVCHALSGDAEAGLQRARQARRIRREAAPLAESLEGFVAQQQRGGSPPAGQFLTQVRCFFGFGRRLSRLSVEDRAVRPFDPRRFAAACEALAASPETESWHAIALLRAARYHRLAGAADEERRVLERAESLALGPGDIDVRRLVLRRLARALLDGSDSAAWARAESLARQATQPDAWTTNGELADAWCLVARACLARGDRDGAAQALDQAAAQRPWDRRELDALRAELDGLSREQPGSR